jgi:hypothetical protein
MTVATGHRAQLSDSTQSLIDSRLDTIDRMLLGRVSRTERMAIVREVESQIHELLSEQEAEEPSREDVLAVLARLDPPEAYLGEEGATESAPLVRVPARPREQTARRGNTRVGRVSGILGLSAVALLLLFPVCYLLCFASNSEVPLLFCLLASPIILLCGVLGVVLGAYARWDGAWAVVGFVTGILSVLFLLVCTGWVLLERG